MNRLTARAENGMAYLVNVKPDEQAVESQYPNTLKSIMDSFERLASYEDAEEAGLLIQLPCKEGTTVYRIVGEYGCYEIKEEPFSFMFANHIKWGRLFLTYEAAKSALINRES